MDQLYWLALALLAIVGIWVYARYWYHRPSGMPEPLIASYCYEVLEFMDTYLTARTGDPVGSKINLYPHIKDRRLSWRQRNDVINYMLKMGWIYKDRDRHDAIDYFALSKSGKREVETASYLSVVVENAARAMLQTKSVTGDQAKLAAGAVVAGALRVYAHSATGETRGSAEARAKDIEKAVKSRDLQDIDLKISLAKDILQFASAALPFIRDALRFFGIPIG